MNAYDISIKGLNNAIRARMQELSICIYHVEMCAKVYNPIKKPKKYQRTYLEWIERALELHNEIKRLRMIRSSVKAAKYIKEILDRQNHEYYIWNPIA
ncbi:MAG: hypothetical protein ACK5QX_01440 [bacterium]|jgi:sporulation-control protein spo0M